MGYGLSFQLPWVLHESAKQAKNLFIFPVASVLLCGKKCTMQRPKQRNRRGSTILPNRDRRAELTQGVEMACILISILFSVLYTPPTEHSLSYYQHLLPQRFWTLQWAIASVSPTQKNKCSHPKSGPGAKGDGSSMAANSPELLWLSITTTSDLKWVEPWHCHLISSWFDLIVIWSHLTCRPIMFLVAGNSTKKICRRCFNTKRDMVERVWRSFWKKRI